MLKIKVMNYIISIKNYCVIKINLVLKSYKQMCQNGLIGARRGIQMNSVSLLIFYYNTIE